MVALSYGQQRLWMSNRLDPGSDAYNVPFRVDIDGPLDTKALNAALRDVVVRHETLRTIYPHKGDLAEQHVLAVDDVDVAIPCDSVDEGAVNQQIGRLISSPFDLTNDLPLRSRLWRLDAERHVLAIVIHHIATDGASTGPFWRDLSTAYSARLSGRQPDFAPLAVQYTDYAEWHRDLLGDLSAASSLGSKQLAYWTEALDGLPPALELPTDYPLPPKLGTSGHLLEHVFSPAVHNACINLARDQATTVFIVLQALIASFLTRVGAGEDIGLGSPVAGRSDSALEPLVGFFVNTLPFRVSTAGDPSLEALINRTHKTTFAGLDNQDVPFDKIVESLNPERSLSLHPFFQVMFTLQSAHELASEDVTLQGCTTRTTLINTDNAKFALSVGALDSRDPESNAGTGLTFRWAFNSTLFSHETAQSLFAAFVQFTQEATARPELPLSQHPLIAEVEQKNLLAHNRDRDRLDPFLTLDSRFFEQARATPDTHALISGDEHVSYETLANRANALARQMRGTWGPDCGTVLVLIPRSVEMVVALLAALASGATYVLLDPTYPEERLDEIARQCKTERVVTTQALSNHPLLARLHPIVMSAQSGDFSEAHLPLETSHVGRDVASILFTSGSTGKPKGVLVPHRAMLATLMGQDYANFGPGEVFLQCSPVPWDGFSLELFGALLFGGTCVLHPGQKPEPAVVRDLTRAHSVTMLQLSASLFNFLADEYLDAFAGLTVAFTGGEPASPAHLRRVADAFPALEIRNGYGPAESMGFTTCHSYAATDAELESVPIGVPINHKGAYVLDSHLRLVPPGVVGEVYLTGEGLAHGYLDDRKATALRFVADPYGEPGSRMYRTGDLARWHDGRLMYGGRSDRQIKIRGFRVEPAEVNTALLSIPNVRQSAVTTVERKPGDRVLVAFVVGQNLNPAEVKTQLSTRLPEHLIPTQISVVGNLPMTDTGKLDVTSLSAPPVPHESNGRSPRNATEEALCEIFSEVLDVPDVTIDDNFFDLGGHSLIAARTVARIRTSLLKQLDLAAVFLNPTVAELSHRVEEAPLADERPALRKRN